jgi:hypothetical protein
MPFIYIDRNSVQQYQHHELLMEKTYLYQLVRHRIDTKTRAERLQEDQQSLVKTLALEEMSLGKPIKFMGDLPIDA